VGAGGFFAERIAQQDGRAARAQALGQVERAEQRPADGSEMKDFQSERSSVYC
jgi:hypothetical protein